MEDQNRTAAGVPVELKRMGIRAFRTTVMGTNFIVFTRSRGAARYATVRAANDAGYNIGFHDVTSAKREPALDGKRGSRQVGRCYSLSDFCA
jgi:hypothetical protein